MLLVRYDWKTEGVHIFVMKLEETRLNAWTKAVAISHFNVISDLIQFSALCGANQNYAPLEEQRFRPGDIASGGMCIHRLPDGAHWS